MSLLLPASLCAEAVTGETAVSEGTGVFSFTSSKEGGINIKTIYADGKLCGVEQMER